MKKAKKIIGLIVTVIMVSVFAFTAFAENISDMQTGEVITLTEGTEYYRFVPGKTANYIFSSQTDVDVMVTVYDSNFEYIDSHDDVDIDNGDYNFCLEIDLTEGETYYIEIYCYDEEPDYSTVLFKVEEGCEHLNVSEHPAVDATCTEDGCTAGRKCEDCGKWLEGNEIIPAGHTETNGDRICEVCNGESLRSEGAFNEASTTFYKLYLNGELIIYGEGEADYQASSLEYDEYVSTVYIGEGINHIDSLPYNDTIEKYVVDELNGYYKADSYGVLFTKDGKKLLYYPRGVAHTSYSIPEGTERIENSAFSGAENLESITVPDSIEFFCALDLNEKILEDAYWEDNLCYLGDMLIDSSFGYGQPYSKDIYIKEGTRIICTGAISVRYYNGNGIHFPDSLETVCDSAISAPVSSYHLTENILYFGTGNNLIYGFTGFTIDENNSHYTVDSKGALYTKDMTTLVTLPSMRFGSYTVPDTVTEIGEYAFYYSGLSNIVLPEGITEIKPYTFCYTGNLESMVIPSGVKRIGEHAFRNTGVAGIVIPESVECVEERAFSGTDAVFFMNPDCVIEEEGVSAEAFICGYTGSTAEEYASLFSVKPFMPLDEGHSHIYIPLCITASSCTQDGETLYYCPCGESDTYTKTYERYDHWYNEDLVNYETGEAYCEECGIKMDVYEGCECRCHSFNRNNFIDEIIYKFLSVIWKVLGLKKFCDCGLLHY